MDYYPLIFKRKSFHLFRGAGRITGEELAGIQTFIQTLRPLDASIRTAVRIVPESETTCRRGAEYCIELYSEEKGPYLRNIGYIGEQIDLYLAGLSIGALWFGIGKPDQAEYDGLSFIIMIAMAKMPDGSFRKDMFKAKRKPEDEIWIGGKMDGVGNIVRFSPSACNTQPWIVEHTDGALLIYRYKKPGKRGIMPANKVLFYNRIDIGIFLFILEVCLTRAGYAFSGTQLLEDAPDTEEKVPVARYALQAVNKRSYNGSGR